MRKLACCLAAAIAATAVAAAPESEWRQTVDKAILFLKRTQDSAGSWSRDKSPGVPGVTLTGMLRPGRVTPDDPVAAKALAYIESLINEKAGHIAGADPKPQLL